MGYHRAPAAFERWACCEPVSAWRCPRSPRWGSCYQKYPKDVSNRYVMWDAEGKEAQRYKRRQLAATCGYDVASALSGQELSTISCNKILLRSCRQFWPLSK